MTMSSSTESTPAAFWDRGYANMTVSTMGGPNHDIVELAAALPPRARVLDLGCGEGRNAFYLAGRGHEVTATDLSEHGIAKLERLAAQAGLPIRTAVEDIALHPWSGEWDLIMAHGVIDYLERPQWRALVEQAKAHTAPGGFNAYTCMLFDAEHPEPPEFKRAGFKHSLEQYELAGTYADWELVRHDRYVKWDQHPGIPIHCHPVDKVLARRPGGPPLDIRHERVPTGTETLSGEAFHAIAMGLDADEVLARHGAPAVIDRYGMGGIQVGVGPHCTVDGYNLSLWFYGRAVLYVINGRVWGRSLLRSEPVRVRYERVAGN
jgi:tellurite methyltransferase